MSTPCQHPFCKKSGEPRHIRQEASGWVEPVYFCDEHARDAMWIASIIWEILEHHYDPQKGVE